jgi:hypothetical protein
MTDIIAVTPETIPKPDIYNPWETGDDGSGLGGYVWGRDETAKKTSEKKYR